MNNIRVVADFVPNLVCKTFLQFSFNLTAIKKLYSAILTAVISKYANFVSISYICAHQKQKNKFYGNTRS